MKSFSCDRIANEYQAQDGFSDVSPTPSQIVISVGPSSSDSENCVSTDESESDESEDEINVSIHEQNRRRKCVLIPKTLF